MTLGRLCPFHLRREYYVFICQHHLGSAGSGSGLPDAGGLRHVRGRLYPSQEHRQYPDEEPHGLLHWHTYLLASGLWIDVCRARGHHRRAGPLRPRGLFRRPARRGAPVCLPHFPDGLLRHVGHHRLRGYGGADQVHLLLPVLLLHLRFLRDDPLFAVSDISSSLRIIFADHKFYVLSGIFVQIFLVHI